jgi:hypothetical protein
MKFRHAPKPKGSPGLGDRIEQGPCKHLGGELRTELIRCQTCRGNVRQKFPVHACEVFGECLPTYTGEAEGVPHRCKGCECYEALPPVRGGG